MPPAGSEANFSPLLSGLYPTLSWRKFCKALFCEVKGDNEFEFLSSLASGGVFWGLFLLVKNVELVCLFELGKHLFLLGWISLAESTLVGFG